MIPCHCLDCTLQLSCLTTENVVQVTYPLQRTQQIRRTGPHKPTGLFQLSFLKQVLEIFKESPRHVSCQGESTIGRSSELLTLPKPWRNLLPLASLIGKNMRLMDQHQ